MALLCVGANGVGDAHAPLLLSLSTVNASAIVADVSGFASGVRVASVVAGPHASGLATGASAPPLNCSFTFVNGCSGFSENIVVSWPVVSLGVTSPFTRTDTPYLADSASTYTV